MAALTDDTLWTLLSALNDELASRGERVHLVVIGGSALLATGFVERPTRDVDVVAIRDGGVLTTAEPLPTAVTEAAAAVATNFALAPDWINGRPTALLSIASGLPAGFADRVVRRTIGDALVVDFAGRVDLIHLKLYALADRGEPRDYTDLVALNPSASELQVAAAWARTHNMPGPFDDQLAVTLARLGVDDDGR